MFKWNNKTRNIVIILGALLISGIGAVGVSSTVKSNTNLKDVIVAKDTIKPFEGIQGKVESRKMVESEIPSDAVFTLQEIEGEEWFSGEIGFISGKPIQKSFITKGQDSAAGLGVMLKKGQVLVGIAVDQVQSVGDNIKPGTLADAYIYVKDDEVDMRGVKQPGRVISPQDNPKLSKLLVVERQTPEGLEPGDKAATNKIPSLAVVAAPDEETARILVKYQQEGKIHLLPTGVDGTHIPKKGALDKEQTPEPNETDDQKK
ncbi:RcpC/CpaB family pilus assembly protein [Paenibacillus melissococcoides]|uniref:RcpC/CpaB family pilus assembly protein n=1 Tax=Paenibacillus melissococcoides TaxID=2912268 RepID=A0ABN8UFJ3_9BACL|nr:RcpC/CpaB family pilus assembly protein [Paenibacillus melissococcoides]CAH8248449.1 RcpC/CpaB family pilus assembly protein [Paenibacillus melissococcoides]CAH8722061.1 RcpC/CpaB family pilus assembly protein [Paenibacillus melissococcoides]CAH8722085.1 RcpC/CpaB family pilus assembly protein [Paenibacillus melissococcoides]